MRWRKSRGVWTPPCEMKEVTGGLAAGGENFRVIFGCLRVFEVFLRSYFAHRGSVQVTGGLADPPPVRWRKSQGGVRPPPVRSNALR